MGKTQDLGRRIEIHSADKHCHDISVGLYQKELDAAPAFLVHTYSQLDVANDRIEFIRQSLITMLGLEPAKAPSFPWLRFPCGYEHSRPLRRSFLDLCKLPSDAPLHPKPLAAFDKKAECELAAESCGGGKYRTKAMADNDKARKRVQALARGYAKLCNLDLSEEDTSLVQFPCGTSHDELIGMLMYRAQNVRASMKEEELAAGRGVLAPPSQQ